MSSAGTQLWPATSLALFYYLQNKNFYGIIFIENEGEVKMKFVQIEVLHVQDAPHANQQLRQFIVNYPKRRIISVNMVPATLGWFMTIAYEVEV